jgi:hypothetical protein
MLMISVDEVMGILEEYAVYSPDEGKILIQRINQASMFIDNIGTVSKWISIKDRLPVTTGIYFVYMPNNAEQQYGTDVYIELQHTWACNQTYITHWMPLPKLPKE